MQKLSKDELKKVIGGLTDPPPTCDETTCEAKSNSNLGDCTCSKNLGCVCVKVWE